jgi:hypothetical protein
MRLALLHLLELHLLLPATVAASAQPPSWAALRAGLARLLLLQQASPAATASAAEQMPRLLQLRQPMTQAAAAVPVTVVAAAAAAVQCQNCWCCYQLLPVAAVLVG